MKLKKAAPKGMIARKIMVVACMVNSALNICAVTSELFGVHSCSRITSASRPPMTKNVPAETPYRMPMRLWSTVVNQLHRPR